MKPLRALFSSSPKPRPAARADARRPAATSAAPAPTPARAAAGQASHKPADSEFTPRTRHALLELNSEIDRLREEATALRERLRELEELADTDPLAPVYNRRAFVRELERMAAYAERYGGEAGLIFVDLNGFKRINDLHGHAIGDAILKHVAEMLADNVRSSDIVGRMGGDEFAVGLARGGLVAAQKKAKSLEQTILATPVLVDGVAYEASATLGATVIESGETAEHALSRADAVMYERKRAGRINVEPGKPATR